MASSPSDATAGSVARLLIEVAAQATMLGREAARAGGVEQSTTAWFALAELHDGGALRLGALAGRLGIGQPATSSLVRRLEARGWLERVDEPLDRRVSELQLTALGREVLDEWDGATAGVLAATAPGLDRADRETLARALEIIVDRRLRLSAYRAALRDR